MARSRKYRATTVANTQIDVYVERRWSLIHKYTGGRTDGEAGTHRRTNIKKADTAKCDCPNNQTQTGEHLVEGCSLLADARNPVEREEMCMWKTRHIHKKPEKKKKGPVEPEKVKEEEVDKLESFFCKIYDFHNPVPVAPVFVPAELPPRYAISFVPPVSAVSSVTSVVDSVAPAVIPVSPIGSAPSTDYSIISSVNFVAPSVTIPVSSSSSCIGPTQ